MAQRKQLKQLIINNVPILIQAETFEITPGRGNTNHEAHQNGDQVELVWGRDSTTKVGKMKFEFANTSQNTQYIEDWQDNAGSNVLKAIYTDDSIKLMEKAILTDEPAEPSSSDSNISVEFAGNPIT